ncbi:fluoride efflux transporter CrcB [Azospirillum sp. RWY-5-1]|uniref:Fluoride-specific ion channel FluC n=1 Tax=Azospirillum oleiclasticum TaxID=2735135 RepID=A0ABX2T3C8_9PROT|nr:fluoride efflux transporter CrcB [Azospirillum oleiclasticum]NYZ11178.1 fluoride efflux transporter CrcB [Azospirillum oleiclasticum]NYZ18340.1 fluoride efflux transporter CrcB [Azospirillum oleiclasticum]
MTPSTILAVAVGGALGSVARYAVATAAVRLFGTGFPWGTMIVNALGCFTMGVLAELAVHVWSPPVEIRALVMVGVLGGFTTFSSFALDVGFLTGRGALGEAAAYALGTLILTVGGFFAGLSIVRALVSVPT